MILKTLVDSFVLLVLRDPVVYSRDRIGKLRVEVRARSTAQ